MAIAAPEVDQEVQELVREGRRRARRPLAGRQLAWALGAGTAFLLAALALALLDDAPVDWEGPLAVALLLAYAVASRQRLELGAGETDPTLLVLVPMLLLLPPAEVPLLVAAALVLALVPEVVRGEVHWTRLLLGPANAWSALGPAIVVAVADLTGPDLADWPVLLLALAASFAFDTVVGLLGEAVVVGVRPRLGLRVLAQVWALDVLLFPVGLAAALAADEDPYAWLLLAPLLVVFAGLARERSGRLSAALALAASRAETLSAVSHGLQRPVASIVGFAALLRRAGLEGAPAMAATQLDRDAQELRHRLRQALDLTSLRAGRPLEVAVGDVDVAGVVREVGEALAGRERLRQVLLNLCDNALAAGPPVVLRAAAAAAGTGVLVEVRDAGPGLPDDVRADPFTERPRPPGADETTGAGIGLHVTGAVAEAIGVEVTFADAPGGGTIARVTVPPA